MHVQKSNLPEKLKRLIELKEQLAVQNGHAIGNRTEWLNKTVVLLEELEQKIPTLINQYHALTRKPRSHVAHKT